MPVRNPVKMNQVNSEMYEAYGHTVLGLRAMGYPVNIDEFNHYVYSPLVSDRRHFSNIRETHKRDIAQIKHMLSSVKCTANVYILSNAPPVWCQTALECMGIDPIPQVETNGLLKPESAYYERIERAFQHSKYVFVDDKMVNLRPVMHNPKWQRVLYVGADATDITHYELPHVTILNNLSALDKTDAWMRIKKLKMVKSI